MSHKISRCCCRVQMRLWTKTQCLAIYSWKLFHVIIGHLCALFLARIHWTIKKGGEKRQKRGNKEKGCKFFSFLFFETKRDILAVDGLKLVWKFQRWERNRTGCFRNNGTKVNWVSRTSVKWRKKFFNKHQNNSFPGIIFLNGKR